MGGKLIEVDVGVDVGTVVTVDCAIGASDVPCSNVGAFSGCREDWLGYKGVSAAAGTGKRSDDAMGCIGPEAKHVPRGVSACLVPLSTMFGSVTFTLSLSLPSLIRRDELCASDIRCCGVLLSIPCAGPDDGQSVANGCKPAGRAD